MLRITKIVFFILLFVFIFGYFSVQIWDPDFWWHLKTGQYIYQTGSLPKTDPFAYTSLPPDPTNEALKKQEFTLTQYWLAELIFYWVYHSFGFQGIIFLRASIFTILILLLYLSIRREGLGFYSAIGLLIPATLILHHYTGERPQLLSFLFSFLLVYLLDGFRKNKTVRYLFPIPLIMLFWANLHGGFVLGIIIVLGYLFTDIIKHVVKRFGQLLPPKLLRGLTIACILSIIFSYVNPNGYTVLSILMSPEKTLQSADIVEWRSPLYFLFYGNISSDLIIYCVLCSMSLLLLLANIKRIDLTDIAILVGFAGMSLSAARFVPFFTPVGTLMVARYGLRIFEKLFGAEVFSNTKNIIIKRLSFLKFVSFQALISVTLSIILIFMLIKGNLFESGVRRDMYPEMAVKFLKDNRLPGNMFNPYVWGGYLIWALYPEYKVFIDGRGLVEAVYLQSKQISEASTVDLIGLPEWKALLKAYKVNFIITFSVNNFTGTLIPLIQALYGDPEWHLIYMDNYSLIFIRDRSENMEIIRRFDLPKEWLWNEVIVEAALKARAFRRNMNFYITIGDAFVAKKSYKEARAEYLKVLKMDPENAVARQRLDIIKSYGY
jgi:hypothetical protein